MKKRILLTSLMVVLFVFILAFSVSAKDFDTGYVDKEGNRIIVPTYDNDGNALTWIKNTSNKGDTSFKCYEFEENGTTYYIYCRKTAEGFTVDGNYKLNIVNGKGIAAEKILVFNADGVCDSKGVGPTHFGFKFAGALKYVYIPSSIVSTQCITNTTRQAFLECTNLEEVEFGIGSQITEIGSSAFKQTNLTSIVLPEGVTTLSNNAFNGSSNLRSVYIPKGAAVKQTEAGSTGFAGTSDLTVYFTGTEEEKSAWDSALDISVTYVNHCDVYYGEHKCENDYNCLTALICERCDTVLEQAKDSHQIERIASYESGYTNNGYKKEGCVNCGTFEESGLAPLFTCQGYSTQQAGGYGIIANFAVNNDAIKEYEDITGAEISYGLFAVLESRLGEGNAFDESGKAINGTINTDLTEYSFDLIEFKLTGIKEADIKTSVAMGAYISVNDGKNIVTTCMQVEDGTSNGKYSFISYNALASTNNN